MRAQRRFSLLLVALLASCASVPVVPLEPIKVRMPADVRVPCDLLPSSYPDGLSMGDLYSAHDALIDQAGECALRDAAKLRWVESQGL